MGDGGWSVSWRVEEELGTGRPGDTMVYKFGGDGGRPKRELGSSRVQ